MEDVTTIIYKPETLISIHTSKPIEQTSNPIDTTTKQLPPIFWCGVCNIKLQKPVVALQHVNGRQHKLKVNASKSPGDEGVQNNALKRKLDVSSNIENGVEGSPNKKSKHQTLVEECGDVELKCETCEKEFGSLLSAVQHFKGKKHASMMEAAYKQKLVGKLDGDMKCEDCDKEFSTALLTIQHFKGKKHAAKLVAHFKEKTGVDKTVFKEKNAVEETDVCLTCEVCDNVFTSPTNARQHFQGRKHAKAEAIFKMKKESENCDPNINISSGLQHVEGERNGLQPVEEEMNDLQPVDGEMDGIQPVKREINGLQSVE